MNYLDFYLLADALVAEKFEGSPNRSDFSDKDWYYIRNAQKVVLEKSFDSLARKLLASRNFEAPMRQMADKINQLLSGTETRDSLRYVLQSEHDTHLVNAVTWLQPSDNDYVDMPFASQLMMELHYT
jgi:DNA helicase IV